LRQGHNSHVGQLMEDITGGVIGDMTGDMTGIQRGYNGDMTGT
jgi:hypothetical protein